jgi:hypothetical protein
VLAHKVRWGRDDLTYTLLDELIGVLTHNSEVFKNPCEISEQLPDLGLSTSP